MLGGSCGGEERGGVGLPGEADEDGAGGAVVVLGLLEEGLDVLADGGEIALLAHDCWSMCAFVFCDSPFILSNSE